MKVICCECGRSMGEKMGPDNLVTHGICTDCMERTLAREHARRVVLYVHADNGVPTTMTLRVDYTMEDGEPVIAGVWYNGNIFDYLSSTLDSVWLLDKIAEQIKADELAAREDSPTLAEVNAHRGYDR